MADESDAMLLLRDSSGQYYLLPVGVLEEARVPRGDVERIEALIQEAEVEGYLASSLAVSGLMSASPTGNVMELLFLVMRDAVAQSNEDKKYYLQRLSSGSSASPFTRYPP
jgi:hypothetical protein